MDKKNHSSTLVNLEFCEPQLSVLQQGAPPCMHCSIPTMAMVASLFKETVVFPTSLLASQVVGVTTQQNPVVFSGVFLVYPVIWIWMISGWWYTNLHLWKMMDFVSWDDDSFPTEWKVIKIPWFQSPPASDMFTKFDSPLTHDAALQQPMGPGLALELPDIDSELWRARPGFTQPTMGISLKSPLETHNKWP